MATEFFLGVSPVLVEVDTALVPVLLVAVVVVVVDDDDGDDDVVVVVVVDDNDDDDDADIGDDGMMGLLGLSGQSIFKSTAISFFDPKIIDQFLICLKCI